MKLGILGGSGLYDMEHLNKKGWVAVDTPFGAPSDDYLHGTLGDVEIYFLPRHARGHKIMPTEINHRANIFGFKKLGVNRIVSVSAVGSLHEGIRPRDIVIPDQYFDRTKTSADHTFFGHGIVAHVTFGEPLCPEMRAILIEQAGQVMGDNPEYAGRRLHAHGTYVNMAGPAFSTRAESNFYRLCGFDVIGMTSLAEAKLCREAEISYAPMAMVTDYDCWHEEEADVSVDMVIVHLMANVKLAQEVIAKVCANLPAERNSPCVNSLENAIITTPDVIPDDIKEQLRPIIGKYIK